MKYYYYDLCARDGDIPLENYKDKEDFKEGLMWNRDVAKENGDKVPTKKETLKFINDDKEEGELELNGAIFIKCNDILTYQNGAYC
jgi:hypothetical protein